MTQAPMSAAMVTASYGPDFERCRLLCETIDSRVSSLGHHYILVEQGDVAKFRALEGKNRTIVDERDILPKWLRPFWDPTSKFSRRVWLSPFTMPLRGWHVQQLRRIGIAAHVSQDVLVYCDSDVAFVKPFDLSSFAHDGKVRLFRRDDGLSTAVDSGHAEWMANAGEVLGIPASQTTKHDYISTLIAWRRRSVLDMLARIEDVTGRNWARAIASERKFSECMIYGRYVDEICAGENHFADSAEWCRVEWLGQQMSDDGIARLVDELGPEQSAICIQSFIRVEPDRLRRILGIA